MANHIVQTITIVPAHAHPVMSFDLILKNTERAPLPPAPPPPPSHSPPRPGFDRHHRMPARPSLQRTISHVFSSFEPSARALTTLCALATSRSRRRTRRRIPQLLTLVRTFTSRCSTNARPALPKHQYTVWRQHWCCVCTACISESVLVSHTGGRQGRSVCETSTDENRQPGLGRSDGIPASLSGQHAM